MMTSCVAQHPSYRGRNYPQRHRTTSRHYPQQRARVSVHVNVPSRCPYYNPHRVFQRIVLANKLYNPYWGGNPNLWGYDNPTSAFWPMYINKKPFKFYYTNQNSIGYYTSTNIMIGVSLDNQILVAKDNSLIYICNVQNGRQIARHRLQNGYAYTTEVRTSSGWRLVEIFFNGSCYVNYMDVEGNILETYELF